MSSASEFEALYSRISLYKTEVKELTDALDAANFRIAVLENTIKNMKDAEQEKEKRTAYEHARLVYRLELFKKCLKSTDFFRPYQDQQTMDE